MSQLSIRSSPLTARRRGFTLVELCVVLAICCIALMLLIPARRGGREAARRMQCANNLKQIGLAMMGYHEAYHCFPPAYTVDEHGNRLHSWRTLLLPFLEQKSLASVIDMSKPWDDPANQRAVRDKIGDRVPDPYRCVSHKNERYTSYVVVVDPESCFTGAEPVSVDKLTDGSSNTLLVIEVPEGQGVEWMSPYDADWNLLASLNEKTRLVHAPVYQTLFADGSVRALNTNLSAASRRSFMTIAAGDRESEADRRWLSGLPSGVVAR